MIQAARVDSTRLKLIICRLDSGLTGMIAENTRVEREITHCPAAEAAGV